MTIVPLLDLKYSHLIQPLSWGEGLLRARSNWRHAVAVTLLIIGESNKKINLMENETWSERGTWKAIVFLCTSLHIHNTAKANITSVTIRGSPSLVLFGTLLIM